MTTFTTEDREAMEKKHRDIMVNDFNLRFWEHNGEWFCSMPEWLLDIFEKEVKKDKVEAIKQATEEPAGWIGYYEGKVCTFIFKKEDVDEFLKNTDPVGKVRPVYFTNTKG